MSISREEDAAAFNSLMRRVEGSGPIDRSQSLYWRDRPLPAELVATIVLVLDTFAGPGMALTEDQHVLMDRLRSFLPSDTGSPWNRDATEALK